GQGKPQAPPVMVAAAGDIACGAGHPYFNNGLGANGACQQLYTANMLGTRPVDAVLPLGDLQYDPGGSLQSFLASYHLSWGRFREISHPAIGNHEYDDGRGGQGYWDYWNGTGVRKGRAGRRGRGWYSFDLGTWHVVALNSNCDIVSCRARSRQVKWLRRKLRRNKGRCVLAYMHHPRFSSGGHATGHRTRRLWKVLYHRGVDVVLAGHEHLYERFAPKRPSGKIDRRRGITQFIAGTGGASLFPLLSTRARHSRFTAVTYGVLFMRLSARSFEWSFVDTGGNAIDQGARPCRPGRPGKGR
ncbi:MAG: metallophosphoesterase family protein, partial [Solirubrobacterales bacterium]